MSCFPSKPHLSVGRITFALDTAVVLLGTVIVSKDMDSLIYGMIVTFLMSVVMDKFMYGINAGKMTLIITEHAREAAETIDAATGRGCTFLKAEGSYSQRSAGRRFYNRSASLTGGRLNCYQISAVLPKCVFFRSILCYNQSIRLCSKAGRADCRNEFSNTL